MRLRRLTALYLRNRIFRSRNQRKGHFRVIVEPTYYHHYLQLNEYQFHNFFRMSKGRFYSLLGQIKQQTEINDIELLIYLFRLGHGNGYRVIAGVFRRSMDYCRRAFLKCVSAINALESTYLQKPSPTVFPDIARSFETKTGRNDIVGAIDGTFIAIQKPDEYSDNHYNRKQFYSIHMLAICDWSMKFQYVQVGDPGNTHDSTALMTSKYHEDISTGRYNLLYQGIQYKLAADSAFRRLPYVIKTNSTAHHRRRALGQYEKYSIESGRTCIECIFGILVNRFMYLGMTMREDTFRVKWVVKSACIVHNFLRSE
jgi:hypothetical protein